MIQKSFSILFTMLLFFASTKNLIAMNFQTDSLTQSLELNSDSTQVLWLNDYDYFLNFRINNPVLYELPDSLFLQLKINFQTQSLISDNFFKSSLSDQWRINEQLNNFIQFQNRLTMKSDLGVFGKVLNHSKNLTTIILAIIHIIKYRKGLY
jgi:hypothetical protein